MPNEFVVNLHVTERCNFNCSHCFGKWGVTEAAASIFEDMNSAKKLIAELTSIFPPPQMIGARLRFNFVGGEPGLFKPMPELVSLCKKAGAATSFVSNGLMLNRYNPGWISQNFDIVGLSIDSASPDSNRRIGRATKSGVPLDLARVSTRLHELRSLGTFIKVNTVVSSVNYMEDFTATLRELQPDKWKIFQMLPVYDDRNCISDDKFNLFIRRHKEFSHLIYSEDNDEMTGSYVMIDPLGRFFWYDGSSRAGYSFSRPILDVGADEAFSESRFLLDKYADRYK